jgi:acyl-CoA synthetase (AMP-forming)/AMP-acid ligase II
MMFMADSPWFVAVFLAAMRIGAVPGQIDIPSAAARKFCW